MQSDLQLCHVQPVAAIDPKLMADEVPSSVSAFFRYNDVSTFKLDRPYAAGVEKSDNEAKVKNEHG
jgi:hypothetical protein